MVSQQQVAARTDARSYVPLDFANAATRYQAFREVEVEHLARMARHNLLDDWSPETRATVLAARHHVREAGEARTRLRRLVRDYVAPLRAAKQPLPIVLRTVRSTIGLLEQSGAIRSDDGWFEAEVLEWVIQEFESVE
ncbi:MAG: hypothetical protein ABI442_09385 [Gemmatimonadaceae bacterium]